MLTQAFPHELLKLATERPDLGSLLEEIQQARTIRRPRKGARSKAEPVHVRYGPAVHYGKSRRHGPHYARSLGGKRSIHLYRKRMYVGDARKGKSYSLSPEEQAEVAHVFAQHGDQDV